jgi:DNA polymerase-3 subunit epsilon
MLFALDTETTGVDVETDRVVTACAAYVDGSGKTAPRVRSWLAWPGIDIPDGATKVHGITTEEARTNGLPAVQVISEVAEAITEAAAAGIPVVAFNAAYDLTILDRETRRYELDPLGPALDQAGALVIDPWLLDKGLDKYRKGSRTLGAVAAHYGVKAEGAHSADGDALAAARVAWKIANDHASVTARSGAELLAYQAKVYAEHSAWQRSKGRGDALDGWPWRPLAVAAVSR